MPPELPTTSIPQVGPEAGPGAGLGDGGAGVGGVGAGTARTRNGTRRSSVRTPAPVTPTRRTTASYAPGAVKSAAAKTVPSIRCPSTKRTADESGVDGAPPEKKLTTVSTTAPKGGSTSMIGRLGVTTSSCAEIRAVRAMGGSVGRAAHNARSEDRWSAGTTAITRPALSRRLTGLVAPGS